LNLYKKKFLKAKGILLYKRYGVFGSLRLIMDVIHTILFFPKARLVRRPAYVRGKSLIRFGNLLTTGVGMRLDAFSEGKLPCIVFGDNVELNDYVHIGAVNSVTIGNNVLIASKVFISDHNHGFYGLNGRHDNPLTIPKDRELSCLSVTIEDNVWLGEFVAVLPGVTIGKGSIIGAMSVVTKDIPPYSIAVGSPAKVIKRYNFDKNIWERI
jgi:lipopolysaccharide O-acetyltransferase